MTQVQNECCCFFFSAFVPYAKTEKGQNSKQSALQNFVFSQTATNPSLWLAEKGLTQTAYSGKCKHFTKCCHFFLDFLLKTTKKKFPAIFSFDSSESCSVLHQFFLFLFSLCYEISFYEIFRFFVITIFSLGSFFIFEFSW